MNTLLDKYVAVVCCNLVVREVIRVFSLLVSTGIPVKKKGGGVTINRKKLKRYPFYLNILMQFITESNL